jgi:Putative beta-lactamase-inhibitor-like, PepSY-like
MKKVIFFISLVFIVNNVFAQANSEIPSAVKAKFESLHPGVIVEEWEKDGSLYEAEYQINKIEYSDVFDASGNLVKTEMEISVSQLPTTISDYFSKNYPGKRIKSASKITDASGKISYEAEIGDLEFIFDQNGNLLRSSSDREEKENDKD